MDWRWTITAVISALGLIATAIGGVMWVVVHADTAQDRRMDRTEKDIDRHTDMIINHERRILRLEADER